MRQAAIACFGVSAALFALALAFIASAEDYAATPDDRLMYHPEARVSEDELDKQRCLQRQDEYLLSTYFNRRILPSVTVLGTLAGLTLVVLGKAWWPGPVVAASAAIAVALVYLIDWWKGSNWWLSTSVLPGWSEAQLAEKYRAELTRSQKKRKSRDEMLHLPVGCQN